MWPDWVPAAVRQEIAGFWATRHGRGPQAWAKNARDQGILPLGAEVRAELRASPYAVIGSLVHAWNNVGRLVFPDGRYAYCSYHRLPGGGVRVTVWSLPEPEVRS